MQPPNLKKCLLLGGKALTKLDSILKNRDITLWTTVRIVKAMTFPVAMEVRVGPENAEHQRIDVSEMWCWRRLLRIPQTARRSNQVNLKEINPEYSLEGLMLRLKF